eukprot:1895272-Pleurochrysis_carterae.AAC.1
MPTQRRSGRRCEAEKSQYGQNRKPTKAPARSKSDVAFPANNMQASQEETSDGNRGNLRQGTNCIEMGRLKIPKN